MLLLLWHWKTFYCHIALGRKRPALHVLSWVNPLQVECWLMILLWFPNQAAAMQSNRLFNLPPFSIPALSRPVQVPTWVWKNAVRWLPAACLNWLFDCVRKSKPEWQCQLPLWFYFSSHWLGLMAKTSLAGEEVRWWGSWQFWAEFLINLLCN